MVDNRRLKVLSEGTALGSGPVLYVMARDQRVQDNWALIYALEQANTHNVPLMVLFTLGPAFQNFSARHNEWLITSLTEVSEGLKKYQIPFFIEMGDWVTTTKKFIETHYVSEVVLDFNPLEPVRSWREELVKCVATKVTLIDAHNIVPVWQTSPKAEFAAYTIRPKIHRILREYLKTFPKLAAPKNIYSGNVPEIDWQTVREFRQCNYSEVIPIMIPGEAAAKTQLKWFINNILPVYEGKRNDPTETGTSGLSPYLRWGNISAQRVALEVENSDAPRSAKDAFLEELIVRRELAENYCFYTPNYTSVTAAHAWAQKTLLAHVNDKRDYVYSFEEFRDAKTHDNLWNAAQIQMVKEGKMHGFLRMYWAKKILEWTETPQQAIDIALKLNDYYELDGRDSNGVVGVMWSICGVHDRAWNERPIFGKVRYMNYAGCKRKFDVKAFESKYNSAQASSLFS